MNELETLIPQPTVVVVAGVDLTILPLKVGQLPRFLKAAQSISFNLEGADLYALVRDHGDALIDAIAIAIERPRDWIEARELNELIAIGEAVVKVNADFFVRSVAPALTRAMGSLTAHLGPALSSGSSAPATAKAKSSTTH